MKLKIITALTLVLSLNIYSQETIKRTDYYENSEQIYSQFYVLKNDTSIKHGQIIFYKQIEESDYKFFKGDNQERLYSTKGQFEMNKKIGRWEFLWIKITLSILIKKN